MTSGKQHQQPSLCTPLTGGGGGWSRGKEEAAPRLSAAYGVVTRLQLRTLHFSWLALPESNDSNMLAAGSVTGSA